MVSGCSARREDRASRPGDTDAGLSGARRGERGSGKRSLHARGRRVLRQARHAARNARPALLLIPAPVLRQSRLRPRGGYCQFQGGKSPREYAQSSLTSRLPFSLFPISLFRCLLGYDMNGHPFLQIVRGVFHQARVCVQALRDFDLFAKVTPYLNRHECSLLSLVTATTRVPCPSITSVLAGTRSGERPILPANSPARTCPASECCRGWRRAPP